MKQTEAIWNRFSADLVAFIRSRIPCPEDASDLLQEAFLKLMNKPPAANTNPRGWLFVVVRNLIHDYYRNRRQVDDLPEHQLLDEPRFEVTETETVVSAWLRPMLADVPQKYATAVILADFEGATMKQIAQELGLSLSGAKSRVQRGRKLLTRQLQDCCSFQFDQQGRVDGWSRNKPCDC